MIEKLLDISNRNPELEQKRESLRIERNEKWKSFFEDPCIQDCLRKYDTYSPNLFDE